MLSREAICLGNCKLGIGWSEWHYIMDGGRGHYYSLQLLFGVLFTQLMYSISHNTVQRPLYMPGTILGAPESYLGQFRKEWQALRMNSRYGVLFTLCAIPAKCQYGGCDPCSWNPCASLVLVPSRSAFANGLKRWTSWWAHTKPVGWGTAWCSWGTCVVFSVGVPISFVCLHCKLSRQVCAFLFLALHIHSGKGCLGCRQSLYNVSPTAFVH